MPSVGTVISYPIPIYQNVPIQPDYYQPRRFVISAITTGQTTTITTSTDHDYVVGQNIRLLIPIAYGSYQLNNQQGYVLSIPSTTQVLVAIDSTQVNAFIANPYTATITGVTNAINAVVTANNTFKIGNILTISGIVGMTELNQSNLVILSANSTSFTLNIDSSAYGTYISDGTATLQQLITSYPQILAIGDINEGVTNTSGRTNNITYIPGSFLNISPN